MKKIVLTALAVFTFTLASAQQENNKGDRQRMTPPDPTEQMTKELGLSADQQKKVKALNEEYKELFRGPGRGGRGGFHGGQRGPRPGAGGSNARPERPTDGNTAATAQQQRPKGERPDRAEMEKRFKEHQQKQAEYDGKLKGILSADQYTKYQKAREERMNKMRQRGDRQQKDKAK